VSLPFTSHPSLFLLSISRLTFQWMVTILFLLSINVSIVLAQDSSASAPKAVIQYDRFKDETSVGVSAMLENYIVEIPFAHMQEFLLLLAGFTYKGEHFTNPPATIRLAFQSQARSWRFTESMELLGIVDGTRINFGTMSYSRKDLGAGHVETMRLDIPSRTFLKLARGYTAELRLGNKEIKLGKPQLSALATLADQFTSTTAKRLSPTEKPAPISANSPAGLTLQQKLSKTEQSNSSSSSSPAVIHSCPLSTGQK
jgi:hypothetical protein